ncbi:alanine racemase [bacterium BMS3Bbin05]|nr:alanine racemase [bacterium BMS3Bbin05]
MIRKASARIDLDRLALNYSKVIETVSGKKIIAVIKADAYGHGAVEVAARLEKEGVYALGVAYVSEAAELRTAGIKSRIIVFFDNENIGDYFRYGLTPVIFDRGAVGGFAEAAGKYGGSLEVHVKIDTGMGRVGLPAADCVDHILDISRIQGIKVGGIMSHFSDADLKDRSFALLQLSRFNAVIGELRSRGMNFIAHIANSAGILTFEDAHLDAVRPGLMMYGYSPVDGDHGLLPVMTVKTHIISIRKVPEGTPVSYGRTFVTKRPSLIGVVPVGYADGYSRLLSNRASVIIRGNKAPVAGRVCMDLTMVDVTGIEGIKEGDEVILLSNDIKTGLTARELADHAGTIPYEILTSLGSRALREHVGTG